MSAAWNHSTDEPGPGEIGRLDRTGGPPEPGLVLVFAAGQPACALVPVGADEVELGREHPVLRPHHDRMMSRHHARIAYRDGAFEITDLGSRNGSALAGQPFQGRCRAQMERVLRLGHSLFLLCHDVRPFQALRIKVQGCRIEGPALQQIVRAMANVALHSRTLFITGESGAGKEALAQAFHRLGPQSSGPFVPVNCATLPESVAERLLFGARKGAYSGALNDSEGYVEAASGGTLFLDEIADLGLAVQAKLLRCIESGEVTPLGATRPRKVDLRVCSATNADLRALVAQGRFRSDLYFRLGVPQVLLPPLRERLEEIPWLVAMAVQQVAKELLLHTSLIEACLLRHWPGNARELLAEIHSAALAALSAKSSHLALQHLSPTAGTVFAPIAKPAEEQAEPVARTDPDSTFALAAPAMPPKSAVDAEPTPATPSEAQILAALFEAGGNLSLAARVLGLHRTQLRRYLSCFGIDLNRVRTLVKSQEKSRRAPARSGS